jgi:spermidine/putrescine transport system ATP-binding protein
LEQFLEFRNLCKSYGSVQVLDQVNLEICQGEIFSLLGPSGCGKTTLLRLLAGFEAPDSGQILLNGKDITHLRANRRPVNTVFQNYALFPHMTIRENIGFGLWVGKQSKKEIDYQVDRMLELIQMADHAHKKPGQISGGQKQRVAIARALVNKPQVLLLDEPLAALDLKLRQRMLIELDHIHDEVGITFLFVTHDQNEAMSLSDRIAVMNQGRIEQVGTPAQIYETPESSFTAAFIGDTNFFDGKVVALPEKEYSKIEIDGLPDAVVFNDRPRSIGDLVHLSVRPEKLTISQDRPSTDQGLNILEGVVENLVYLGAGTRYWIRVGEWLVSVFESHKHFLLDKKPPTWEDRVWLTWHRDDGYMLQRYREADEELLTLQEDDPMIGAELPEEPGEDSNGDQ